MSARSRHAAVCALSVAFAVASASCNNSRAQPHAGHGTAPTASSEVTSAEVGHEGHAAASQPEAAGVPSGYAAINVGPSSAEAIGLTTTTVGEREFRKNLRTTGIVTVDETRTSHVHTKVRGWVDGVMVNFVGHPVNAGQVLCGIYSQEVYAAEIEYLALLGRVKGPEVKLGGEFAEQERRAREELLAAARRRLQLWDVPKGEIERLETTREPRKTFPLVAPRSGIVVAKQVLDGTFVDASTELYTVSDLSRVWLLADIYESDVRSMNVGQVARLDIQGADGPIEARVAFLPPTIDEPTRTLKVRFELANTARRLRPGAFADVRMDLPLGRGLAVPESAVIRTGARAIVFLVHGGRHILPREVKLGALVDDFYRIEGGLEAGDVVATGAQFLLDSETRLRASGGAGAGHGGH